MYVTEISWLNLDNRCQRYSKQLHSLFKQTNLLNILSNRNLQCQFFYSLKHTQTFLLKHNSASEMCIDLNIVSSSELLPKFVFSFKAKVIESDNSLVHYIVKSTILLFSTI